jgi:heme A synthase
MCAAVLAMVWGVLLSENFANTWGWLMGAPIAFTPAEAAASGISVYTMHRCLAFLALLLIVISWIYAEISAMPATAGRQKGAKTFRRLWRWAAAMAAVQVLLGAARWFADTGLFVSIAHQLGAVLLAFVLMKVCAFVLGGVSTCPYTAMEQRKAAKTDDQVRHTTDHAVPENTQRAENMHFL